MSSSIDSSPALASPAGATPNFDHSGSGAEVTVVVCFVSLTCAIVFVALRLYSRIRLTRSTGRDDYACVSALVGSMVFSAATVLAFRRGYETHMLDIRTVSNTLEFFRNLLFFELSYEITIYLVKLSLFLLYLRLFSPNRRTRYLVYAGIIVTGLYYIIRMIVGIALCSPNLRSGKSWKTAMPSKHCINFYKRSYEIAAMNILSDLYTLGIPVSTVWGLQMPVRKRVGVIAVFTTGLLVCMCSVLNAYYRIRLGQHSDVTWHFTPVVITSLVEVNVGIVCGCIPITAAIFRHENFKSFRSTSFRNIQARLTSMFSKCSPNSSKGSTNSLQDLTHIDPYTTRDTHAGNQYSGSP